MSIETTIFLLMSKTMLRIICSFALILDLITVSEFPFQESELVGISLNFINILNIMVGFF